MARLVVTMLLGAAPLLALAQQPAGDPPKRLLIAFSSYRDRPKHAQVYFYEDGVSKGMIVGSIDTVQNRQDYHPILSRNGRFFVYLFDRHTQKLLPTPGLNSTRDDLDPA
jgi:hypothetical protein